MSFLAIEYWIPQSAIFEDWLANPRDWWNYHRHLTIDETSSTTESTMPLNARIFAPWRVELMISGATEDTRLHVLSQLVLIVCLCTTLNCWPQHRTLSLWIKIVMDSCIYMWGVLNSQTLISFHIPRANGQVPRESLPPMLETPNNSDGMLRHPLKITDKDSREGRQNLTIQNFTEPNSSVNIYYKCSLFIGEALTNPKT